MSIIIRGNKSYNNGGDGIRLVNLPEGSIVEDNLTYDNKGQGISVVVNLDPAYAAGLSKDIPQKVLDKAAEILLQNKDAGLNTQEQLLKKIDFDKWLKRGYSLATIVSVIISAFNK